MLMDEYFTCVFVKAPFSFFFLTIDSHECLRENTIIIQIYSPMRKYGQHDFWNFFNGIVVRWYSSTERLRIARFQLSSVWKPRKFKLPGWLYEQFRRSHHEPLLSLTNSLKMYHVSILIVKRARNLKTIPASWPTDVAILLNWLTTWY